MRNALVSLVVIAAFSTAPLAQPLQQPSPSPEPEFTDSQEVVVFVPAAPVMRTVWRPITGLAIAGAAIFVFGYTLDLGVTGFLANADVKQAAIPLAGPWLQFNHNYKNDSITKALLGIDGVVQAAGAVMLIVGMSVWRKQQRPATPGWTLLPFATPQQAGLQLTLVR